MNSLTEEQRRRIEANRQAALAKCRERRNKTVQKENRDQSIVAAASYPSQSSGCNNVAAAAVAPSSLLVSDNGDYQRKREVSCNSSTTAAAAVATNVTSSSISTNADDSRKRKIEAPPQHPQQLTKEQRIRMETNRKRALEKKQKQQLMNTSNSSTLPSSIPTDEQRARIEENRRKALEKKQSIVKPLIVVGEVLTRDNAAQKQTSQVQCAGEAKMPSMAIHSKQSVSSNNHAQNNTLTQDQLARMEENRRRALEKKNQTKQVSVSLQTNTAQLLKQPERVVTNTKTTQKPAASLTEEQKLRIEQNRLKALQKKQLSSSTTSSPSKSSSVNDSTTGSSKQDLSTTTKPLSAKKSALPPLYPELQYDPSRILPVNDDDTDSLIENAELDKLLLNGWTLYDHQKEGVLRALRMRRLILAFDMGLGKTIIGCVWAKAFLRTFVGIKIFVIAPVSLHEDWRRTAGSATGLKVDSGKKKKTAVKKKEEPISEEYYATGKKRKSKKKKGEEEDTPQEDDEPDMYIYSWNNVSAYKEVINDCTEGYIVICDEAHNMQSMTSQRTKDALKLMQSSQRTQTERCRGVLLLSGTPMKNGRPSNLFPLLQAVRHPFGDHQMRYESNFCDGQQRMMNGKEVWLATGSSNLRELNAHTASHIFRMTKEECMSKELPPRKRELRTVPVGPLQQQRYTQALNDLAKAFTASKGECGGDSEDILTPFNRLRQISSFAKVDAAVSIANSILNEESSIVVFTSFVDIAKQIHQKLEGMDWAGELLTGETATKKRQLMVDNFQSGLSPVFVCTYGAGGVGLTLTAACTVILVDRPWTPGDVNQAEDRVRRIGQKRPVRSIWIRSFAIDEQIDELLEHKDVTSNTVVDGKASTGQSRSAPKVKISELIKNVIETK